MTKTVFPNFNLAKPINLTNHVSVLKAAVVNKVCKPLFQRYPITYFCYLRRYRDGGFTFLPSVIDLGRYYFEGGVYQDTWFGGLDFDQFKSGYLFSDIAEKVCIDEVKTVVNDAMKSSKLSSGIDVIEKHNDHCDFYYFASDTPELYTVSFSVLHNFIYYFKNQCHDLLLDAQDDRCMLARTTNVFKSNPIIQLNNKFDLNENVDFETKRFYLSGKYEGIYLTRREVDILRKMDEGDVVKQAADNLCISPRTLEQHITNIKEKLGVSRYAQALHILRQHKLIT